MHHLPVWQISNEDVQAGSPLLEDDWGDPPVIATRIREIYGIGFQFFPDMSESKNWKTDSAPSTRYVRSLQVGSIDRTVSVQSRSVTRRFKSSLGFLLMYVNPCLV